MPQTVHLGSLNAYVKVWYRHVLSADDEQVWEVYFLFHQVCLIVQHHMNSSSVENLDFVRVSCTLTLSEKI